MSIIQVPNRIIKPRFEWRPRHIKGHPLSIGLVGHWMFNEGAGLKAWDISGFGNHGTLANFNFTGDSGWWPGKFGQSLLFDGVNDYVSLSSNPLSSMSVSSASMWVKLDDLLTGSGGYGQTFLNFGQNANNGIRIGHDETAPGTIFVSYLLGDLTYGRQTGAEKITANAWYHIAYTFDGSTLNVYINGVDSDIATNTYSIALFYSIGARDSTTGASDGLIDEARIYKRALSPQEVMWLYQEPFADIETEIYRKYWVVGGGLSIPVAMRTYRDMRN